MNRYCNAFIASATEIHVFKAKECTLLICKNHYCFSFIWISQNFLNRLQFEFLQFLLFSVVAALIIFLDVKFQFVIL